MRNMIIHLKIASIFSRISLFALVAILQIAILISPMTASVSLAQDAPKAEKKKTLSFEDELVEGATQKPELFYLFQKKNFNYKRLIKLRENFLPEMRKTSEDLQRVRSSN